jgi:hypothetical protein
MVVSSSRYFLRDATAYTRGARLSNADRRSWLITLFCARKWMYDTMSVTRSCRTCLGLELGAEGDDAVLYMN